MQSGTLSPNPRFSGHRDRKNEVFKFIFLELLAFLARSQRSHGWMHYANRALRYFI